MKRHAIIALATALLATAGAQAQNQSRDFSFGKNMEIQISVLRELSRSFVDSIEYDKIVPVGIEAMLQSLDPYTTYIPEENEEDLELMTTGYYGGIGSLITKRPESGVIINEPYEGSPAVKAGLQPGDVILVIDGKSVIGETSEQSSSRMKGQPGTDVRFKVVKGRTGDTVDVVVTRERIKISDIEYSGMLRDSIGYIKLTGFTDKVSEEFREEVIKLKNMGARRVVIDLRGNGGGIMDEAVRIVSTFVPKGTVVVTSKGRTTENNREYRTSENPVDTIIPLLVMINSGSASASEITAGAIQDLDRGIIAGKRSYGKGLIQSVRPLPFGGNMKFTTGKYYTPSGRCVQALDYSHRNEDGSVGYVPDSLKQEFKTKKGRSVFDGGGITPDIETEARNYSRIAYSLVYSNIINDYAIEYYKKHLEIARPEEFHLTDAEYDDFVEFASAKEFDARGAAETVLDQLVKAAEADGLYEAYKTEIEALSSRIKSDKKTMLNLKKEELLPLVEEDIVVKYYFNRAGDIILLRDDPQLFKALEQWK